MTFLAKLGMIIVKGIGIASGLLPLIAQADPKDAGVIQNISKDLDQCAQIVVMVEAMGQSLGLPGPDKLRAATPQIAQIILQSSFMVGKPIANQVLFQQGCTSIASGLADVLNAVHPSAAVETPVTVPAGV